MQYVAPEIYAINENGYNGEKVDMFSFGVILFILVTGVAPFGEA